MNVRLMAKKTKSKKKSVHALKHTGDRRLNIPTAEYESVLPEEHRSPIRVAYERRNRDLDPQLVWRGKDQQDWSDLVVQAPPLFIQEKIHPKVLIDDLRRQSEAAEIARKLSAGEVPPALQMDLYADFNGIPDPNAKTEFYQHEGNWTNRMILGDSLQVMASLAEREGLRGKVKCIYLDPPYGIKFNSNFQWSTTSRDVKDGKVDHITREPEQVKAFRDTWRDGIHSYLTYLRDRLTVCRELLHESGSVFVQIGDENVHRIRALLDDAFGEDNFVALVGFRKVSGLVSKALPQLVDYIAWYCKNPERFRVRQLFKTRTIEDDAADEYRYVELPSGEVVSGSIEAIRAEYKGRRDVRFLRPGPLTSQDATESGTVPYAYQGKVYHPGQNRHWSVSAPSGLDVLARAGRLIPRTNSLSSKLYLADNPGQLISNTWLDTSWGFETQKEKVYVVQTHPTVVQRCLLMATDPGDLVLDPTCGSGTTAYVAEQWGRRWITIDTSRVALALTRARIMGARYPFYLLADSRDGQLKEAEVSRREPSTAPTRGDIRHGFVYERVPHVKLGLIADNAEINVIREKFDPTVERALADLHTVLRGHKTPFKVMTGGRAGKTVDFTAAQGKTVKLPSGEDAPANGLLEWEVPREAPADWPAAAHKPLAAFWEARIARQREIDASIAAKAEFEYLYDKPYVDSKKVRVAGPFTVESLSPHRTLTVDEDDNPVDPREQAPETGDFATMILETLKVAGVQQAHKEDKITFTGVTPWPGRYICAEGRFADGGGGGAAAGATGGDGDVGHGGGGDGEKRAGIFIGPEFGTVSRQDLVEAAREAGDAKFDVVVACAFSFDAHASEFSKLGRIPVLKARMNADLHMAGELKNTGKGNLFVVFGEPDIDILPPELAPEDADLADFDMMRVRINGVDVFHPQTGQVRSDGPEGIACWFIDTDYNGESFFVRQAYFLGANDPYKSLKTTLKAEIDADSWESLHSAVSRDFPKPPGGRIAVKVINHLGDEVMKVFRVEGTRR